MTTRVKNLNRYQKGVLLLLAGMTLLFTALYLAAAARKGFAYQNAILTPVQVGRETVYSGKIQGEPARFTVYADRTVLFQYGGQTYGPYTIREDPSAVPQASERAGQMTGVELSCGGQLLFRGGVLDLGGRRLLYNTDGTIRHTRADRHGILRFQCRLCLVRFRGWAGCFCGKRIQDILTEIGQEIETDS